MSKDKRHDGASYGNGWMHRTLIGVLRHVDIRAVYVFMYVYVVPVTLLVSRGARLTYSYYRSRRRYGALKSVWATYRNHCLFGQTVVDKFAMYAGRRFTLETEGEEEYRRMLERPEPLVNFNAHIGSSEITGYSFPVPKPCNILVYGGEKESLMEYRETSFGNMNLKMIPVGAGDSHSDDIARALDNGEILAVFPDRYMNKKKVIISTLHGHAVYIARGPVSMAVTRGLDVVMVVSVKKDARTYVARFIPLAYDKTQPKAVQRQQLADAYTGEIEKVLDRYPLQWFRHCTYCSCHTHCNGSTTSTFGSERTAMKSKERDYELIRIS